MNSRSDWLQTFTGRKFFPLDPDPEQISILDIAHALANECRYAGHTKRFYSVAQHSVVLSEIVDKLYPGVNGYFLRRYALLHDASEAYLGDIPRPLKVLPEFRFYREAEERLQRTIYARFGLDEDAPRMISWMDKTLLRHEAHSPSLMSPLHPDWDMRLEPGEQRIDLDPLDPGSAKFAFLIRFRDLFPEYVEELKKELGYAEQQAAFRDPLAGQKKRNAARAARHASRFLLFSLATAAAGYRARLAEWERLTGEGQIAPGDEFRRPEPGEEGSDA